MSKDNGGPAPIKVTPAMRAWCKRLSNGAKISRNNSWSSVYLQKEPYCGIHGGLTYVMVNKMEEAGVIEFKPKTDADGVRWGGDFVSHLTARGIEEAAK